MSRNAAMLRTESDIVLFAVNDFPPGMRHSPERWARPEKYSRVVHAETGVLLAAARQGIATRHATLVCPWAACDRCAVAMVAAGVSRLVVHTDALQFAAAHGDWPEAVRRGHEYLRECGVELIFHAGRLGDCVGMLDGKPWEP